MVKKQKIFKFFVIFFILFNLISISFNSIVIIRKLDKNLYRDIEIFKLFIPLSLQDNIIEGNHLTKEEFHFHYENLSKLIEVEELEYIYTMINSSDESLYTIQGGPEEELYTFDINEFYLLPANKETDSIHSIKRDLLTGKRDEFIGYYTDQWGTYRALLVADYTPKGNRVIIGVEYNSSKLQYYIGIESLKLLVSNSIIILFIIFITLFIYREHSHERKHLIEEGMTDELTGLYNRKALILAEQSIANSNSLWACIYFDLDGLKKINDTLGHQAGDKYIKVFSEILKSSFRGSDILLRNGGDEFIAFTKLANEKELKVIFNRIKEKTIDNDVSVSLGYIVFDSSKLFELENIIKESDQNMYKDKLTKKNHR